MESITIEEARRQKGLSLEQLALLADTSYSHVARASKGWIPLSPRIAARLAPVLGVSADALIAGQAALRERLRARVASELQAAAAAPAR